MKFPPRTLRCLQNTKHYLSWVIVEACPLLLSTALLRITAFAVQCYITIAMDDNIMHRLLMCSNQRNTFVNAVAKSVQSPEILHSLFHIQCSAKHANFQFILQSVFNCCAKNQLKRINSRPNLPDPPSKAMRCIKKLTGKSSSDQ